jgi:glycosyltransferase involved in cell wall biosynthesis
MAGTLARQEHDERRASAAADARSRHLLHVMPSFGVGGIQIRLARLANALGRRYRHTILTLSGDAQCSDRLDAGIDAIVRTGPPHGARLPSRLFASGAIVRQTAPDLLLTYNWGAIEWALANRLFGASPHIHFEDGFGPEEIDRQLPRRMVMRRWALAGARQIVVPSRRLAAIALNDWRLDPTRVRHIPNGIDVDAFRAGRRGHPPSFARTADEVIVGTVAPLRREKNLARLVRAVAALPRETRVRLVVAGDGGERAMLEDLARELGIADRVVFLGPVSAPERALAGFDIFALSSDTEQMPLTILEAMAAALPVAAVDVGDVRHMLAPANRILVAAREDEAGFAAALWRLVTDEALRRDLGQRNEAHVRDTYPWRRMVDAYDRVFGDA